MEAQSISTEDVIRRKEDWLRRIQELYSLMDRWRAKLSFPTTVVWGETTQRDEYIFERYGVPLGVVPTYAIHAGDKRVVFEPVSHWVYGTNGRIDAIGEKAHTLLDLSKPLTGGSDWRIATNQIDNMHPPFDEEAFRRVMQETFGKA